MGTCQICDATSPVISDALGLCPDCISRQLPFLVNVSTSALLNQGERILRICWETNGSMSKHVLADLVDSALNTGGVSNLT